VKWTPEASFCRSCGAAVLKARDFGPARMLKDAGTDRFTIPKLLADLDPEQVEDFRRIYQRHAIAVERHTMRIRELEKRLWRKDWSARYEDEMTARLPLNEEDLQALEAGDSAVDFTRGLEDLAALQQGSEDAYASATRLLSSSDRYLREEAAMSLSHWRVLTRWGVRDGRRLLEALLAVEASPAVAVRVATLGGEAGSTVRDALDHRDPDIAFQAALALGDAGRLGAHAVDPDQLRRLAAGEKLVDLGEKLPLVRIIPSLDAAGQERILKAINRRHKRGSYPELRSALFDLAESTTHPRIRSLACAALCPDCPPAEVLRIARAAKADPGIYQDLLQRAEPPPDVLESFGEFLLREGHFRMGQYGMSDVAKPGRMPETFVPRYFDTARETEQIELIRFAEEQLAFGAGEMLHAFLIRLKFDPNRSPAVHSAVWSSLHRWYYRIEVGNMGPMVFGQSAAERFFGALGSLLDSLARFLDRHDSIQQLFVRDPLAKFLRYRDSKLVAEMEDHPGECSRLVKALLGACADTAVEFGLRLECVSLLGAMRESPHFAAQTTEGLETLIGTDLDHASRIALGLASY
jgi:hypothetical protein